MEENSSNLPKQEIILEKKENEKIEKNIELEKEQNSTLTNPIVPETLNLLKNESENLENQSNIQEIINPRINYDTPENREKCI